MAVGKINDRGTMYEIVDTEARNDIQNVRDSLSLVATTGEYNDLLNKPTIDNNTSTTSTNAVENQAITNFVNSSVATNTANFIGTYNSLAELEAHEDYTKPITNNDYGFVISTDSSGNTLYSRYKYNSEEAEWKFEYSLNNSSFTAEQWATINSGVVAADKTQIGTNTQDIINLKNDKVDKETGKGLSTNDFTNELKNKLDGIENGANKTIVDTTLSDSSTNPVQNKVITTELNTLLKSIAAAPAYDSSHTYTDNEYFSFKGKVYRVDLINGSYITSDNLITSEIMSASAGFINGQIPTYTGGAYAPETFATRWDYRTTGYIEVTPGLSYSILPGGIYSSGQTGICDSFYDENKTRIGAYVIQQLTGNKDRTYTIPANVKYIRIGLGSANYQPNPVAKIVYSNLPKCVEINITSELLRLLNTKQDVLTFDDVPTANSNNPVKSSGIKTALDSKADDSDLSTVAKTGSYNDLLNKPTIDSTLSTTSENAVQNKVITENVNTKLNKSDLVELTQSEWDALDNSKYSDDKVYFITDGDYDPIDAIVYGYHIDPNESDPSSCVSYLADAIGMTPASMGTTTFDYGSWSNAFFMPKPCMVKSDGTVDYYLDPNDYTKKVDGTASDITDLAYDGNAMIEWPLIWWKYEAGSVDGEGYFYASNKKIDNTYHCWCNYDSKNNIINHFYTAIYNGGIYNGKLRSMSGYKLTDRVSTAYSNTSTYAIDDKVLYNSNMYICITAIETPEEFDPTKWEQLVINGNTTGAQEVNAAIANDTTSDIEWYIDTWSDRMLINGLLILMGKSLNVQATFGQGITSGSQTAKNNYTTGSLNDKGMFYGSVSGTTTAVKVFGMENWWGLTWHRTAGLLGTSTGYVYKMTYNNIDGSTATSYNSNGSGYLTLSTTRPSANNYVNKMKYGPFGYISIDTTGGSSTTYYCDYYYGGNGYLLVGGGSNAVAGAGASDFSLYHSFASAYWGFGAALSLKPLALGARA